MAGGLLKGSGAIFITVGLVMLTLGLVGAAYGFTDQEANRQDNGSPLAPGGDSERAERNDAIMIGGGVAAAGGLVMTIVGIVLVSAGGSRARNARGSGKAPADADADEGDQRSKAVGVAALVLVLAVGAVLSMMAFSDSEGGILGTQAPGFLGNETISGHMSESINVLGVRQDRGNSVWPEATAPRGAQRLQVLVEWEPADATRELHVALEGDLDGTGWTMLADVTGPPGVELAYTGALGGADLRVRIELTEAQVSQRQDFSVDYRYYA